MEASTASALAAARQLGGAGGGSALDALTAAMSASSAAVAAGATASDAQVPEAQVTHDFEFSNIELVKPTRMNKVYIVFACSILEQDLMFVVYNIPPVGIFRAEQRSKAL